MFGLGKKAEPSEDAPAAPVPAVAVPLAVGDDQFIVMPEEYLPPVAAGAGADKKLYFIIGGALVCLLLLTGGLYWWFFTDNNQDSNLVALSLNAPLPPAEDPVATSTTANLKVIESQAYDSAGQLLGLIKVSLPPLVAGKYGESLGITVLTAADLSLPVGRPIVGGIYSLYPVGAVFTEPVTVVLSATVLPAAAGGADYFPAYLKGATWQDIDTATTTAAGWTLSFDKFPAGPISLVERPAPAATSTPELAGADQFAPSQDSDGDGLTDVEETLLGTNPALGDTDSDTYDDRAEIENDYNPLVPKDKLANADLFLTYTNPTYGYKAPYPKKWLADSLDQTNKQVLFISATEEFFEILVEDNPLKTPIVDWYRAQAPTLADIALKVTTIAGAAAVWSPDGLTLYIGRDGLVFILTYNKGQLEQINWPTLFAYFYKNFKFGNTASPTSAATSTPPVVTTP